jgi:hypothetical protein
MKRATFSVADAAARCTTSVNYQFADAIQKTACSAGAGFVSGATAA